MKSKTSFLKVALSIVIFLVFSTLTTVYAEETTIQITYTSSTVSMTQGETHIIEISTEPNDATGVLSGALSGTDWAEWSDSNRTITLTPPEDITGNFLGTLTFTHPDFENSESVDISVTVNPSYSAPTGITPISNTIDLTTVPNAGINFQLTATGGTGDGDVTFTQVSSWPSGITLTSGGVIGVLPNAPHGTHTLVLTATRGDLTSANLSFTLTLLPATNQLLHLWVIPAGQSGFEVYRAGTGWVADSGNYIDMNFSYGQTFGQIANQIPPVRRTGYVFNSWRLINHNGPQITNDHTLTNGTFLFAHFVPISDINITLNANGGAWAGIATSSRSIPLSHGQTLLSWQNANPAAAQINPTRTGYEFVGWFLGNTRDEVTVSSSTFTANAVLNARWRPIAVGGVGITNVTFSTNGGTWRTGGSANRTYTVRQNQSLSSLGIVSFEALDIVPVRTGSTFLGFRNVVNQNTFLISSNVGFSNITVEAIWSSEDTVSIVFNPNGGFWPGGTISSETRNIARGQNIISHFGQTLNNFIPTPSRSGFNFIGWYVGNTPFTSNTIVNNNLTITARWESVNLPPQAQPPVTPPWASPGLTPGTVPPQTPSNIPPQVTGGFTDVLQNQWFFNYVTRVSQLGIFQGTSAGVFSPNLNMTRAMFVQAISNFHRNGIGGVTLFGQPFVDVSPGSWYYEPIAWAANSEIVRGIGNTQNRVFAPNSNITREQIAVMLFNYANFSTINLPTNVWAVEFADQSEISEWAAIAVSALNSAGVITGRPGNLFDPLASATRAEVAAIFSRFEQFRH